MKYLVAGVHPAYGVEPGAMVRLDSNDPRVQLNVAAGVLVAQEKAAMKCPACSKRVASVGELEAHYGEKHPALATPEWRED